MKNSVNTLVISIDVFMLMTIVMVTFPFFKKMLYRHQGLAAIWTTLFTFLLTLTLIAMGYFLATTKDGNLNELEYRSITSRINIIIFSVGYIISLIYYCFWLKKQLKCGFSKSRTDANYKAYSKVYESKSLWIIFGIVFGVFIGGVFSRLTVESAYSAYLLNTNNDYWVSYREETKQPLKK